MEEFLKNLAKVFVQIALNSLFAAVPGLTWGPLRWIITWIFTQVITWTIEKTLIGGMFWFYDWRTGAQERSVAKVLQEIKDFQGVMNEQQITDFENRLSSAYYDHIEF